MAVEGNFNVPDGCDPAKICEWIEWSINHGQQPGNDAWHGRFGEAQIFVSLAPYPRMREVKE